MELQLVQLPVKQILSALLMIGTLLGLLLTRTGTSFLRKASSYIPEILPLCKLILSIRLRMLCWTAKLRLRMERMPLQRLSILCLICALLMLLLDLWFLGLKL